MPGTSSDNKSGEEGHPSSTKKKKTKTKQERSATQSALTSINEDNDDVQDGTQEEEQKKESDQEDSDGPEPTMKDVVGYLQRLEEGHQIHLELINERLSNLEVPQKLTDRDGYASTPTNTKSYFRERVTVGDTGLLASAQRSTVKQDWRKDMLIEKKKQVQKKRVQKSKQASDPPDDSDTPSDGSGDPSSESSDSHSSQGNGRDRQYKGALFRNLDATERQASKTIVSVTRVEKECKVYIQDFTLAKVCKAMKDIIEFQERESTVVKMSKVLSASCKKHLRIKHNIKSNDLASMSMSNLFACIAKETRVHSKVQFYNELKAALAHLNIMDWEKVTPSNHEAYYFQQLNLIEEFMLVLRIMLEENKEFCPMINDKENGLIRLFRGFHTYSYWKYIWGGMHQRYRTMQEFIDEYTESAMQQYQLSQVMKQIPYTTASKSSDKDKQYYDKKREVSKSLNRSNPYHRDKPSHSVNNINAGSGNSTDDSEESTWKNAPPNSNRPTLEDVDSGSESENSLSVASNEGAADDDDMLDGVLAAFNDHQVKVDKKELPCLRKLMSGKCEMDACPYGHKREVLLKGAQNMKTKLTAFENAQGSAAPFKVLSKEKYGKKASA
jgi:hypothetical protein